MWDDFIIKCSSMIVNVVLCESMYTEINTGSDYVKFL